MKNLSTMMSIIALLGLAFLFKKYIQLESIVYENRLKLREQAVLKTSSFSGNQAAPEVLNITPDKVEPKSFLGHYCNKKDKLVAHFDGSGKFKHWGAASIHTIARIRPELGNYTIKGSDAFFSVNIEGKVVKGEIDIIESTKTRIIAFRALDTYYSSRECR